MRVIHKIALKEIIILKTQPVTKRNTYFCGDIQSNLAGQRYRSAIAEQYNTTVRLAMFNVRYKASVCDLSLISRFLKCVVLTQRSTYLAITPSTVNHAANQKIKCQYTN